MKKSLKKWMALLLSMVMILTCALTVYAQEPEETPDKTGFSAEKPDRGVETDGQEQLDGEKENEEPDQPADRKVQSNSLSVMAVQSHLEKQVQTFSGRRSVPEGMIGTESFPFSIASEEALLDMQEKVSDGDTYEVNGEEYKYNAAVYRLDASIALSAADRTSVTGTASGYVFDGQGYTISGLTGANSLFDIIAEGAVVRNLTLNGELTDVDYGAMLCRVNNGTIENCTVEGRVTGEYAAGIVCDNYGTVSGCISKADIEGTGAIGGIAAYHQEGSITECLNSGNLHIVYAEADTYATPAAGISAFAYAPVSGCTNEGTVTNEDGDYGHAAGIAGYLSDSTVSGCTNTGKIVGPACTGGIAGYSQYGSVTESANAGTVAGSTSAARSTGGIIGELYEGNVTKCCNTA